MSSGQNFLGGGGSGGLTPTSPEIAHDIQQIQGTNFSTSSATPVPVPVGAITLKNFGQNAQYIFFVGVDLETTSSSADIEIFYLVNGTPVDSDVYTSSFLNRNFSEFGGGLTDLSLSAGDTISLEWSTTSGVATINRVELFCIGTPDSSILP